MTSYQLNGSLLTSELTSYSNSNIRMQARVGLMNVLFSGNALMVAQPVTMRTNKEWKEDGTETCACVRVSKW